MKYYSINHKIKQEEYTYCASFFSTKSPEGKMSPRGCIEIWLL